MVKSVLIFVYGTLMSGYNNAMADFLRKNSTFHAKGYFPGYLYENGHYPGAVYDETSPYKVYGEVYKMNFPGFVLSCLDSYEALNGKTLGLKEFVRDVKRVHIDDKTYKSWIYTYNSKPDNLKLIESGDYKQYKRKNR